MRIDEIEGLVRRGRVSLKRKGKCDWNLHLDSGTKDRPLLLKR